MQTRRREKDKIQSYAPDGSHLAVDAEYWHEAIQRDQTDLCNVTFFEPEPDGRLKFRFLNEEILVDLKQRCLLRRHEGQWRPSQDPLLELATVMYLKGVREVHPMGRDIVGTKDLKEGHFFAGPHELRTAPLLIRYGNDPAAFKRHCEALAGMPVDMAETAYRLLPFPRVPLYFLLWAEDEEFKARIRILFDRSIETCLAADAIWALANRVAMAFGNIEAICQ